MSTATYNILLVEDNPPDAELIQIYLESAEADFELSRATCLADALAYLGSEQGASTDLVLLDLGLPDSVGLETFERLAASHPSVPVVVLTGLEDVEIGSMAVQGGAQDYLVKGKVDQGLLDRAIRYGVQRHAMRLQMERNIGYLRTILETSCDGILVIDPAGFIHDLNPAAEKIFEAPREALKGKRFGLPGAQPGGTLLGLLQPGGKKAGVPTHRRALVEMRHVDMVWEDGPMHLVILHDVTESWLMRDQLERVAQRWRSTFNAVNDMIMVLDPKLRVEAANRATYDALDTSGLAGTPCFSLLHGKPCSQSDCPALRTFRDGKPVTTERQDLAAGTRWLEEATYPITDVSGNVENVVLVVRDITDRRLAERNRRHLEAKNAMIDQMQLLNDAKTHFMDMVTHEMRTPMTAIGSGVGLLLSGQLGRVSDRQQQFLEMMERNIKRLRRFSKDVLSLSMLEADRYPLHPKTITLETLLPPICDLVRASAEVKGISLEVAQVSNAVRVWADEDALSQVATNLLTNAVTHCPEGTRVSISWRTLDDGQAEILVADDGPGIAEEDLVSLFDRYARARRPDRHISLGQEGAGLGLAVCRALMERMGGRVEAESVEGEGTTFTVTLPVEKPEEPAAEVNRSGSPR